MSEDIADKTVKQAQADLDFIKGIVAEHNPSLKIAGILYGYAGLIYGIQCLLTWLAFLGLYEYSGLTALTISILPTIIYIAICIYYARIDTPSLNEVGTASRAVGSMFAGIGMANTVMAVIIGWMTYARQDVSLWMLFPIVICAFQGSAWFTAAMILRYTWMYLVTAGWFITALAMGIFIDNGTTYFLVLGAAMIGLMGLSGLKMARSGK
ncbi:hypothetical protein QGN29_00810 [Temperatibacter marinus]|uniref:Uncharacterized protein n=1 Tax=Temperatibacter marinus TaxID=1456591 RepID=A0AA52H9U5_9PROT|nr:hypothetical protein [Temperatibacter marinus]WND02902.1 hypothetical protein QGN29_00810 [Temperatibacter marinus]